MQSVLLLLIKMEKIYHCNILLKQCTIFNTLSNSFFFSSVLLQATSSSVLNICHFGIYTSKYPAVILL